MSAPVPDVSEGRRLLTPERIRGLRGGVAAALDRAQSRCITHAEMRLDARIVAALLDAAEAVERVRATVESLRHQVFGDQAEGAWYVLDAFSNALEVPGE